jgi:hypothetical protein
MTIKEPRLRSLLTQADRNASNGKNAAAESIFRQILNEAPDAEEAWLGLAGVVYDPDEKRAAYERALALAPDTPLAIAGLARLDGRPVPPEIEAVLAAAEEAREADDPQPMAVAAVEQAPVEPHDEAVAYELACYRHPDRSTSLRCYNCDRPICISCANKTPVGYICPECQREAEDAFFNNKPLDYLIAVLVSLPISLLAGYLMVNFFSRGFLFFILIFFISGAVGSFIGRITKRAIGGRRGRYLPGLVVAMMIVGVAIPALPILFAILTGSLGGLLALLGPGIYLFVGASAAYWQMR